MFIDSPTFKNVYPIFAEIVRNKTVLIYNAEFDSKLYWQTSAQDEIEADNYKYVCVMLLYSVFVGDWSEYHGSYKYQRLPGGDHTAIGDCKATLELLKMIAETKKTSHSVKTTIVEKICTEEKTSQPNKKWWQFWF